MGDAGGLLLSAVVAALIASAAGQGETTSSLPECQIPVHSWRPAPGSLPSAVISIFVATDKTKQDKWCLLFF